MPLPGYLREPTGVPLHSPWPGSWELRAFPALLCTAWGRVSSRQRSEGWHQSSCWLGSLHTPSAGTRPQLCLHSAAGGTCPAGAAGASPQTRRLLRASPASREGISPSCSWNPSERLAASFAPPSCTLGSENASKKCSSPSGLQT